MDEELKTVTPIEIPDAVESSSVHNETDDLSSSTEIGPSELLYKPSKSDIIPLVILILGTALCLFAGLLAFFLVQNSQYASAQSDFASAVGNKGNSLLTAAIQSTKVTISDITALFSVTNGSVTEYAQFIPFINSTGSFPPNLVRFYYQTYVPNGQQAQFVANLKASDPVLYAGYYISARNANNTAIPDNCTQTYCLPTTLVAPVLNQSLTLLGFNHYSDSTRVPAINKAIATKGIAATQQIIAATTSGPPLSGSLQYSAAFGPNGNLLGVLSSVFQNSYLIYNSVETLLADCKVSVYDLNATDDLHTFMFSTDTWQGPNNQTKAMTPDEDRRNVQSAKFVYNATLQFGDRTWVATFIPTDTFLLPYTNSFNKYIAIIVMVIAWLLIVAACVFLFFYGRLRQSLQAREASQRRIVALSKFQPRDFLRMIRAVNQAQYVPGKHRNVRVTMMSVELGNLEHQKEPLKNEEIMNLMNEFFEYVKGAAKQNDGFIHTCDKSGFVLLFTNEQKAYNAGVMIHRFPRSEEIPMHVAIHSDKALLGMVGDSENLHEAVVSTELETLRELASNCRKYNRRIVLSQPVLESVKKSCEKNAIYLGPVPPTTRNNINLVNMYEIVEDSNEKRIATKEAYGTAMEALLKHDYLAALTQLQTVLDVDPMDSVTRELRDALHLKLKVCKTTAPIWNVVDTLSESTVLRPIFEVFMEQEKSGENMAMWKEILDFKQASANDRRRLATGIFEKYCVQMDMNLTQNTVENIAHKIKSDAAIEGDLFNFVLSELELLMSDTHNRFKSTRAFINGLCRVLSTDN